MITSISGMPASPLGLAAGEHQDSHCVALALDAGINFCFCYSTGSREFVAALKPLLSRARDDVIVATGSGARTASGLRAARRKAFAAFHVASIDVFLAEYVHPGDDEAAIFGAGGVLDELHRWKMEGIIRYVGASAHDRVIARRLATDARVDVLMHRYNMAHRKAAVDVFLAAVEARTPVIAFTATRWGSLLAPPHSSRVAPPTAADCYRFCLAQPPVQIVLTAPRTVEEFRENVPVLTAPPMDPTCQAQWERYGDLIYQQGGAQQHAFESRWP